MRYLKKCLPIILVFILMIQTVQIPRASENMDYLDITMADIIVAWYNASGVAIGYTSILQGIYTTFGNDTLRNLVNNGIIKSTATNNKEEIEQLIGYGNLTAPTVYVDMTEFAQWFILHPITGDVKDSIEAMFSSLGGDRAGVQGLATVLGMVANLGKIPYSFEPNTASNVTNENITNVTSLKNVYNNFVQTNYFVTLIENIESGEQDYLLPYTLQYPSYVPENCRYGAVCNISTPGQGSTISDGYFPKDTFIIHAKRGSAVIQNYAINVSNNIQTVYFEKDGRRNISGYTIRNARIGSLQIDANSIDTYIAGTGNASQNNIGMSLTVPNNITSDEDIIQYCKENNPWNNSTSGSNGTTEYINSSVGNLDSENYQNANPNITPNEYMYIFNRTTYETIIDTINNNTNNGQYTENGNIINNYNNTYIQDTSTSNVRPSLPPTSGELPAQPFITPRPDLPFEEVEDIIYGGNVPGEIEKKFPFCIPWDVKACIDYFWSPTRKAPHIHWNTSFGEWGNLGQIDIDLAPYNTVATIHRALMLIAWIVGLAILTPKILP